MGRIAEALKKAESDRAEKMRLGLRVRRSQGDRCEKGFTHQPVEPSSGSPEGVGVAVAAGQGVGRQSGGIGGRLAGLRSLPASRRKQASVTPMPPWEAHPSVIALRDRNSSVTEQYRAVRTWLLRRNTTSEHSCLAITSTIPREGKSVTVANLAVVMSEVRHLNVLAVDADFRQGYLSTLFKQPASPGLADVLVGRSGLDESIRQTPLPNLSVLPGGTCQDLNPAELLNSTAAARVFEEIRERYHYVLVDTPPVQWLSDIGAIGALCSGILMVVRMRKTPAHLVRQAVGWLQTNHLNVIGCVASGCGLDAALSGYREPNDDE